MHTSDILGLRLMHDGLACGKQALGFAVPGSIRQIADHILHDLLWRFKAKRRGIADIQLDDAMTVLLHLLGAHQHRPTDVVANVIELGRLEYGFHSV
jgi:hypothetical protein